MSQNPENDMPETIIDQLYKDLETSSDFRADSGFAELRRNAYKRYRELGFPGLKHEEYKYTPILRNVPQNLHLIEGTPTEPDQDFIEKHLPPAGKSVRFVFINGVLSKDHSDFKNLPREISVESVDASFRKNPADISQYFQKESELNKDPFIPLNTSLSKNGLFIRANENSHISQTIYIVHYIETLNPGLFINNHNIIVAGKGSNIKIAEFFISKNGQTYFSNNCSSIFAEAGAILNYNNFQFLGDSAIHVGSTQIHQERDSRVNSFTITLSGGMIRNNLNIRLNDVNAESHLYGLFYLRGKDHTDNHTLVDHRKPHCFSNEYYKGIMDDESKGVFNGKIFVQPQAQKTNAYQSNKNILLSENASIHTKPQLEIQADDVKCTHGTTTGKLDDEQMFYLKSRGLDEDSARGLLIYAFCNELIEKMEDEELKIFIDKKLQERLGHIL
jgi:Fe-S cluster assembly protein SufD